MSVSVERSNGLPQFTDVAKSGRREECLEEEREGEVGPEDVLRKIESVQIVFYALDTCLH